MKYLLPLLILIFISGSSFGQTEEKTKILVLGTFHFHNPGLDVANTTVDDVLAPKRQKEIKEVVELLKRFKPTKVAIEAEVESVRVRDEFSDYLKGKYKLGRNEIDQIGYRLAKELGHKKIFPIDWKGNFDFEKVSKFAKANGQEEIADSFVIRAKSIAKDIDENLKTNSFREIFREINSQESLKKFNRLYFDLAKIGKETNYEGTDLLSDWFERNLKIYTNISRISKTNDRILLIIGASHAPIIQKFLRDSEFEIVTVERYL